MKVTELKMTQLKLEQTMKQQNRSKGNVETIKNKIKFQQENINNKGIHVESSNNRNILFATTKSR